MSDEAGGQVGNPQQQSRGQVRWPGGPKGREIQGAEGWGGKVKPTQIAANCKHGQATSRVKERWSLLAPPAGNLLLHLLSHLPSLPA